MLASVVLCYFSLYGPEVFAHRSGIGEARFTPKKFVYVKKTTYLPTVSDGE